MEPFYLKILSCVLLISEKTSFMDSGPVIMNTHEADCKLMCAETQGFTRFTPQWTTCNSRTGNVIHTICTAILVFLIEKDFCRLNYKHSFSLLTASSRAFQAQEIKKLKKVFKIGGALKMGNLKTFYQTVFMSLIRLL